MKRFNETIFTDKEGKKVKRILKNKLIETSLTEPSQWYIEKILKPMQQQNKEIQEKAEKEKKICRKIREIAKRELEKEKKL